MSKNKYVVIAAGGTGGHVIPAMELFNILEQHNLSPVFWHDHRVRHIIEMQKYDPLKFKEIKGASFAGSPLFKMKSMLKLSFHTIMMMVEFIKNRPQAVIGFGGYVSAPVLFAASLLWVPVFLVEQNSVLGWVNRLCAICAKNIFTMFKEVKGIKRANAGKVVYIGMFGRKLAKDTTKPKGTVLLITGGSQGAQSMTDIMRHVLSMMPHSKLKKIHVVFQTRPELVDMVRNSLEQNHLQSYTVSAFFADMPKRISEATLVISRAGAGTIGELCMAGKPMILLPYPYAKDDHQRYNVENLKKHEACEYFLEHNLDKKSFAMLLGNLLFDKTALARMGENAKSLANAKALEEIAKRVMDLE